MAIKEQADKNKELDQHKREKLKTLIREQVMHSLGEPGNLLNVQVRSLWENYYRVNVVTGLDVVSSKVANSFFLSADGDGNIVQSTPEIVKLY
ncbi:MAG: hypothetical protein ACJ8FY_27475 [Gemmataceae bacterium]